MALSRRDRGGRPAKQAIGARDTVSAFRDMNEQCFLRRREEKIKQIKNTTAKKNKPEAN